MIINARELAHVSMNVKHPDLKAFTNLENIRIACTWKKNIYFSWEILKEKNPLRNTFVLSIKSQTSDSKIRAHSFPDHSPASARYCAPCYRDETGHYVSFEKGSAAQHSRCLLCENTPIAWPDPDNDQTITQLSRPQRRPLLGWLCLQKMRGCRTGVGGLSPGTH